MSFGLGIGKGKGDQFSDQFSPKQIHHSRKIRFMVQHSLNFLLFRKKESVKFYSTEPRSNQKKNIQLNKVLSHLPETSTASVPCRGPCSWTSSAGRCRCPGPWPSPSAGTTETRWSRSTSPRSWTRFCRLEQPSRMKPPPGKNGTLRKVLNIKNSFKWF